MLLEIIKSNKIIDQFDVVTIDDMTVTTITDLHLTVVPTIATESEKFEGVKAFMFIKKLIES